MQIVLHAGMHKTGTTSFQHWLRANEAEFRARGIATFPLDRRVLAFAPKLFDPEGLREELANAEQNGAHTALFSHETLCQVYPRGLARLLEVFEGHPARFVLTLRHWSSYLPSRWMQNSKRRDAQSFNSYLARLIEEPEGKLDAQLWLPLKRAKEAGFKDLCLVPYNRAPNIMLRKLARACSCPEPSDDDTAVANRSTDTSKADRTRMFNGLAALMRDEDLNPMARGRSCIFYDLTNLANKFIDANPTESAKLDQFLYSTADHVPNSYPIFDIWYEELISHVENLAIPVDWSAFTALEDNGLFASTAEFSELPASTAQAMKEHLQKSDLFTAR